MKNFEDRVAVVTGGASGIGRGMAERFGAEGMKIVLADIEQGALDRAVEELRSKGVRAAGVVCDVASAEQVGELARRSVEAFGGVHIICNNAGVASDPVPSWEQTEKDWQWVLNVNLMGVIHGIRAFVPIMLAQGDEGHVVNTASLAGLLAMPQAAPYHASKFAVVGISESLYLEFLAIQSRLRVSVLCPAWVRTNIMESSRNRPADLSNGFERQESAWAQAYKKRIHVEGLTTEYVSQRVFEAVRDEQLYILTHPEFMDAIRWRMENILAERNPTLESAIGGLKKDVG